MPTGRVNAWITSICDGKTENNLKRKKHEAWGTVRKIQQKQEISHNFKYTSNKS
jgi:hypothetical protein